MVLRATIFFIASLAASVTASFAQEQLWIQIEAHPNQADAIARAEVYARELTPVEGYRLSTGWHAVAIGPLLADDAVPTLRQLRNTRQIPSDSYIVDGGAFRGQFWPPLGARVEPVASDDPEPAEETVISERPAPEPIDETPAEARRSEALLTREEKMELQSALAWEGYYNSTIDGAIGRGSRNAMAGWQTAQGYDATGILTTRQRSELLETYRGVLSSIGMATHIDTIAGIDIELPLAMVSPDGYEAPFAHFKPVDGNEVDVILISQSGNRASMNALFEVLQTLRVIPTEGPRSLRRDSFVIEGRDSHSVTSVYAELTGDDVKGFMLIWPVGDEQRRELVWSRMKSSFRPVPGQVIPDSMGSQTDPDALAGLAIRRPRGSHTGFYVSSQGTVLTSASELESCSRVTLGLDDVDSDIMATDATSGAALISPRAQVRPISVASFGDGAAGIGNEFAMSAFSFGGRLGAPTLSFGTIEELSGLSGEGHLRRLALTALPGDAGAPVLDSSGQVLGMVQSKLSSNRILPEDVSFAISADHLRGFLGEQGIEPSAPALEQSRAPEELASLAADFTVLVKCWD